jgi:hypothetical protein
MLLFSRRAAGTPGTVGTNLAQRWIFIKIDEKMLFLMIKQSKKVLFS